MGARTTHVKGGWVKRDAETGRFVAVRSENGTSKASATSLAALKEASGKRKDALKRLTYR